MAGIRSDGGSARRWSWDRLKRAISGSAARHGVPEGESLYQRGRVAERESRHADAVNLYRAACAAHPENAEFHYALAAVLSRAGRRKEAADAYRNGLAHAPENARMRTDFGTLLLGMGQTDEALAQLEWARDLAPDLAEAHHNLGIAHHQLGRLEQAITEIGFAHRLAPERADIHSNLLFILNYSARHSPAEVFAEHCRFGERHVQPVSAPPPDLAWPRPLRIGYVSPDFRSHVVATFMMPLLARHDRSRFVVHCYYTYPAADHVTGIVRDHVDQFVECAGMTEEELVRRIRADRIDILVDLAGHTVHHSLKTFALRPAPVQATYLGYPNTTGLRAIDYRISDAKADPPGGADALCVERLARLPRTFLCYRPGPGEFDPGPPPALAEGHVTFGCFNNFQKLSEPFFATAIRILEAVPGSRLLLKAQALGAQGVAQAVRARFANAGIDSARLVFAAGRHLRKLTSPVTAKST
jgi:predicted O-linked N-acetylglucosamine transferase (SPINDLY family)